MRENEAHGEPERELRPGPVLRTLLGGVATGAAAALGAGLELSVVSIAAVTGLATVIATAALWPTPKAPLADGGTATSNSSRSMGATRTRRDYMSIAAERAPMASLLLGPTGKIEYANEEARDVFFEGKPLEGHNFLFLLEQAPNGLRQAMLSEKDELFSVDAGRGAETYHVARRSFELSGETYTLVMVKHLTRELSRQEVDAWKKLIRLLTHELNNSLAPIGSLIDTARVMAVAKRDEHADRLARVFDTIEDRTKHLSQFVSGYATFARLPAPAKKRVGWASFLSQIKTLYPDVDHAPPPIGSGYFDAPQLEQVVVNLIKNAIEAGGRVEEVRLEVRADKDGSAMVYVTDRGPGMDEESLERATMPFYSTKAKGSGIGLPLCREIIDAHDGKLSLRNRKEGGLEVSFFIPGADGPGAARPGRLTLTADR